jgi:hypothetical protein
MKKISVIIVLVSLMALALSSCNKEESTITGQLTYSGAITGIEYYANGASVYLYHNSVELDDSPLVVTADENGNFSFNNLYEGKWQVYATIVVNGFTYTGMSSIFWTSGEDIQTVNLVLL